LRRFSARTFTEVNALLSAKNHGETRGLDRSWLTPKVKTLAQTIYNNRVFERLPELADALAEAGCSNPGILSHCRGSGPHVRGCWVADLVLGKE
jgi:hypothetical protein